MRDYSKGHHTVFHHRYHLVWITKYRYRVLQGEVRLRVRSVISQVAEEMGIEIVNGVLSAGSPPDLKFWKRSSRITSYEQEDEG